MHSGLSLCALLAGILFILFMQDVEALPVIRNKRASKIVTLPLKRLEASSRNVHPQVVRVVCFVYPHSIIHTFCSSYSST